jgi:phosphoribosylformylglycinamidine cyclo-ligase
MTAERGLTYDAAGVLDNTQLGLHALLRWVNPTARFRAAGAGRRAVDVGFFASVVEITPDLGLALCTDGVGSKVLIAEMLGRYDTIGIDCVAMNANDAICVGAEPISFLDYIAVERATPAVLEAIARGLHEGARQANVAIVGGEISQMPEVIRGHRPGGGLDLVGMCAGIVPLNRIILGEAVAPGDAVIGVGSRGIHSNGFTLARRALFEEGGLRVDQHVAELGTTVGEELLKPTSIYVAPVVALLRRGVPLRALTHITSDGFLNLARIHNPTVGFRLDALPEPPPIFGLIQKSGRVPLPEMYRVFNMGVGFCIVVPNEASVIDEVLGALASGDGGVGPFKAQVIGEVVADERKRVFLPALNLVGEGDGFREERS